MNERALRILAPAGVLALSLLVWDLVVRINGIPPYILPGPGLVLSTLVSDWAHPVVVAARDARNHGGGASRSRSSAASGLRSCSTSRG